MKKHGKLPPWKHEYADLADYNRRVSQGIVHTQQFKQRMAKIQQEYDKEMLAWAKTHGHTILNGKHLIA